MSVIQSLGYLGIGVRDIDAWERFAADVLGLAISLKTDDGRLYLREDHYHHRFILYPSGEDDAVAVGWEVRDDRDLSGFAENVRTKGVMVTAGTAAEAKERGVLEFITITDRLGIKHEIFYGPLKTAEEDIPRSLVGRFQTGPLGLGHFALYVNGQDEYSRFYSEVLGLRRASTRRLEGGAVESTSTWRCNQRHHSVALVGIRTEMPKRLTHFGLHLNSIDDVGKAYEKATDRDLVEVTLGRHPSDGMLSFYMATPSGFQVEFGWDGRLLADNATVDQFMGQPSLWGHKPVTTKKKRGEEVDMWRSATMSKTKA